MRLFIVNCLLLASFVIALPDEKQKRDLSYIKNWITSSLFGQKESDIQPTLNVRADTEYKLYRLPGRDDVLIKIVPKTRVEEKNVFQEPAPVNLNAFSSAVGIKNTKDTLEALKGVNNLLLSGILNGKDDNLIKGSTVPMFPTLHFGQHVDQEDAMVDTVPIVESREPVITEVIVPEEKVKVEVPIEPKYSYIQMKNNEPVMTYTAHYKPEMKAVQTLELKSELPAICVNERINEDIQLGTHSPVEAVFPIQPTPIVDVSSPRRQLSPYVENYFYPSVKTEVAVAEFEAFPLAKDGAILSHYHRRPVKSRPLNPRLVPLDVHTPPHVEAVDKNAPKANNVSHVSNDDDEPEIDTRIGITRTLGPIPQQYIPYIIKKGLHGGSQTAKSSDQINSISIVGSKDNVSNGMIPSYVYNQQKSPNTAKVVKEDGLKINVKTKTHSNVKVPSYYYYVPPSINTGPPNKQDTKVENDVHTNKATANPQNVTESYVTSTNAPKKNPVKVNDQISLKENPIVVPDVKNYVYRLKNADGSSMAVEGNKHGVSVNIKGSSEDSKGRGDIPDE